MKKILIINALCWIATIALLVLSCFDYKTFLPLVGVAVMIDTLMGFILMNVGMRYSQVAPPE